MAGVDLRTVGELLGHRTPRMTWRYSHLAPGHPQRAVDRLVGEAELVGSRARSATRTATAGARSDDKVAYELTCFFANSLDDVRKWQNW